MSSMSVVAFASFTEELIVKSGTHYTSEDGFQGLVSSFHSNKEEKEEKKEGPFGDRSEAWRGLWKRGVELWGIPTSMSFLHVLNEHYCKSTLNPTLF